MCMQSNNSNTLPSATINAIKLLNSQFQEQREYGNSSNKGHKNDYNRYRRKNHHDKRNNVSSPSSTTNNSSNEKFQATVFQSKEGVEKHMSELFTALNKVTDLTYEALKNDILTILVVYQQRYSNTNREEGEATS